MGKKYFSAKGGGPEEVSPSWKIYIPGVKGRLKLVQMSSVDDLAGSEARQGGDLVGAASGGYGGGCPEGIFMFQYIK